jgi:hypothetical protein
MQFRLELALLKDSFTQDMALFLIALTSNYLYPVSSECVNVLNNIDLEKLSDLAKALIKKIDN